MTMANISVHAHTTIYREDNRPSLRSNILLKLKTPTDRMQLVAIRGGDSHWENIGQLQIKQTLRTDEGNINDSQNDMTYNFGENRT